MVDLINPTNFDFFARFLLSGLIIIWIRSTFVNTERPKLGEMVVEAVILSLVNQLTFVLLAEIALILGIDLALSARLVFLLEALVLPAGLGLLFGYSLSAGWNRAILRRLSMPVQNPIRRAYDFAFLLQDVEGFVILTYDDGTKVYTYFGENSLAASNPERSDIYLERLYDVDETGQWYEKTPPRGGLLNLGGLRSIEFLESEGQLNDQTNPG
jgi:hypothetical protein